MTQPPHPSAARHEPAQLAGGRISGEVRYAVDRDAGVGQSGTAERSTETTPERLDIERALGDNADVDPRRGLPNLVLQHVR